MVHPSNIELWFVSTVHTEADIDETLVRLRGCRQGDGRPARLTSARQPARSEDRTMRDRPSARRHPTTGHPARSGALRRGRLWLDRTSSSPAAVASGTPASAAPAESPPPARGDALGRDAPRRLVLRAGHDEPADDVQHRGRSRSSSSSTTTCSATTPTSSRSPSSPQTFETSADGPRRHLPPPAERDVVGRPAASPRPT